MCEGVQGGCTGRGMGAPLSHSLRYLRLVVSNACTYIIILYTLKDVYLNIIIHLFYVLYMY